jgi:hypothetical protein
MYIKCFYIIEKQQYQNCTRAKPRRKVNNKLFIFFQDCGETALHLAISRELGDGSSLHIVDFLVQNGGTQLLDKTTSTGMTAIHLCTATDRTEPMKLLLKAGADPSLKDGSGRTALQIARQMGHHACQELVSLFDTHLSRVIPEGVAEASQIFL